MGDRGLVTVGVTVHSELSTDWSGCAMNRAVGLHNGVFGSNPERQKPSILRRDVDLAKVGYIRTEGLAIDWRNYWVFDTRYPETAWQRC